MKNPIRILLVLLVSIPLLTSFAGGTSNGDRKSPLTPIGFLKDKDKEVATVKVYRSSDHFGILQFGSLYVLADKELEWGLADGTKLSDFMETSRDTYTSKDFKPGVHKFTHHKMPSGTVIANLEAGRTYYLAVAFYLGGLSGLEFRTRDNFLNETKSSKLIEKAAECGPGKNCTKRVTN